MKILAIRGKNLASLAGEFVIDFTQEPLASAGVFAISGPTGAGKSTLLDALCLALYDNTPRLKTATSRGVNLPDVGDETISPSDARNLLRRGCSEGYAEVDFFGNDGQPYRARWNVRRARGRSDGKLQNTELQLTELTGNQRIGSMKTEVQTAIVERLGLSFDQFTRAVLLAQNEFGAFLKASDDERSNLLQTLTGTEIYSRISKRAFERAKTEGDRLKLLQAQLAGQQPLDEQQRADLQRKQQDIARSLEQQEKRKGEIDRGIAWHEQRGQLESAHQQAADSLAQAQDAQAKAIPRQQQLILVEAAQSGRSFILDLDRTRRDIQLSTKQISQAEGDLATASAAERAAISLHDEAGQAQQSAEQNKAEALPQLQQARQLDAEIGSLEPHHRARKEALGAAWKALTSAECNLQDKLKAHDSTHSTLETAQAWLQSHADRQTLGEQWPRWDTLLQEAGKACGEVQAADQAISQATKRVAKLQKEQTDTAQKLEQTKVQQQVAEDTHREAEQAQAGFDAESLAQQLKLAADRREHLHSLQMQSQRIRELEAEQAAQTEKLAQIEANLQQQQAAHTDAQDRLPSSRVAHQQAVRMLKIAEAACSENVEQLRARLEAGNPCPVCGAVEHPYALTYHPFQRQLAELQIEVDACQQAVKELESQESRAQVQIEQLAKQLAEVDQHLNQLAGNLGKAQAQFTQLPLYHALQPIPADQRPDWFTAELVRAEEQHSAAQASLAKMMAALERAKQTRQALDKAIEQQTHAQQTHDALGQRLKEAERTHEAETRKREEATQRLETHLAKLDPAFNDPSWRQTWQDDPTVFHQQCEEKAQSWRTTQTQVQELTGQLAILKTELEGLASVLTQAQEQAQTAQEAFDHADQELSRKRTERAGLFEGRPADEIEANLDRCIAEAKQYLQDIAQQLKEHQQEHTRCSGALLQARKLLEDHRQAATDAEAKLNQWIATFNAQAALSSPLDEAQLRAWLQHDPNWIANERQVLQELSSAVQTAQAILQERRQQLQHHLKQWPEPEPLTELKERQLSLSEALKTLQTQNADLLGQLRQDDARHQTSADLMTKIAAQEATTQTWAKLNELIGSADGKKFRNIAQQITLDVLLGYANQHLKDLSRRYRLERVKSTLALQVVDQDMGDEIRSVHSLSGGESFLVSLALALGLASLSSNRVRVESLFIDEGFGSLDADTLRVAMDALDSLQSLGRKVGVISHVQEMSERIGTRIQVKRAAGGFSKIVVCGI